MHDMHEHEACAVRTHCMHAQYACTVCMHNTHAQYACTVCMHSMHAQYAGIVCMWWGWLLGRCDCNTCSECDERNEIHFVSSWGLVPSAGFLWLGSFALVPVASSLWLGSQEPLRPEPLLLIASQFCIPDTKPQIPLPLSWPEVKKCHRR